MKKRRDSSSVMKYRHIKNVVIALATFAVMFVGLWIQAMMTAGTPIKTVGGFEPTMHRIKRALGMPVPKIEFLQFKPQEPSKLKIKGLRLGSSI